MKKLQTIKPGDRVPRTGLYNLDKGTRIVPVNKLGRKSTGRSSNRR